MKNNTPQTLYTILEENNYPNHFNYSINHLNQEISNFISLEDKNYSIINTINGLLAEQGQRKFIHLSPGFEESKVAVALYCGNGLVAKIIPKNTSDRIPDITNCGFGRVHYIIPSIKSFNIKGNHPIMDFKLKFYPYIFDNNVTKLDIENFKDKISSFGLEVKSGDDKALNFRRLPDKERTLVGIDSDMIDLVDLKKFESSKSELENWVLKIKNLYTLYSVPNFQAQNELTNFNFIELVNRTQIQEKTKKAINFLGMKLEF